MTSPQNSNKRLVLGAFLAVALGAGLFSCQPIFAAASSQDLDQMEVKLYDHSYPNDSQEDRIKRLENMVFGESQSGSTQQRLEKLLQATGAHDDEGVGGQSNAPAGEPASSGSAAAAPTQGAPRQASGRSSAPSSDDDYDTNSSKQTTAPQPAAKQSPADQANYPRVDALERKVLGKTYAGEPVAQRLTRLEEKQFGAETTIQDLSERTDRLEEAAGLKDQDFVPLPGQRSRPNYGGGNDDDIGMQPFSGRNSSSSMNNYFGSSPSYSAANPSYSGASPSYGSASSTSLDQRVASMEQQVFGKSLPKSSLTHRVERLEKVVVPDAQKDASANMSLPARVDRLANALGNQQTPLANTAQAKQHKSGGGSLLGSLAKALAGMGGMGMGMGGMGMGMGSPYGMMSPYSMSPYSMPYGMASPYSSFGGISPYGMRPYGMPYGYGTPMYGGSPGMGIIRF